MNTYGVLIGSPQGLSDIINLLICARGGKSVLERGREGAGSSSVDERRSGQFGNHSSAVCYCKSMAAIDVKTYPCGQHFSIQISAEQGS